MAIKIRDIEEESCSLYDTTGNYIGEIKSELQFIDVLIQIKEQGWNGFYIKFRGKDTMITNKGQLVNDVEGLFDKYLTLIEKLLSE